MKRIMWFTEVFRLPAGGGELGWEQNRCQGRRRRKSAMRETTHSNFLQHVRTTWKLLGPRPSHGADRRPAMSHLIAAVGRRLPQLFCPAVFSLKNLACGAD